MTLSIRKFLFSVIFLLSFFPASVLADDMPANPPEKEGYILDFADEFNEDTLDTEKWIDSYLPHWCADPSTAKANYRFENGCLIQYIDKDQEPWCPELDGNIISSAIMSFDKNWIHNFRNTTENHDRQTWYGYTTKYGYFEIRAKLADCGGGGHQAWWLVGMQQDTDDWNSSKQTGEIDIIENFFPDTGVWKSGAFGWNDTSFSPSWTQQEYVIPSGSLAEEFHIYAMEWTPEVLKFYFDNQLVNVISGSPSYEMGAILNIYANTGDMPSNDVWPKEWYIDYYRVWKPGNGYSGINSGHYLLRNRSSGKYAYINPGDRHIYCGELSKIDKDYAVWFIEETGDGYFWIQNLATDEYIHTDNQTGNAEHNVYSKSSASTQWKVEANDSYFFLINRAYPDQGLHTETEGSILQCQPYQEDWWSAQWELIVFE